MKRAIVTYAADAHQELLDVALPTYRGFAERHGYDVIVGDRMTSLPPAWNKVPLLLDALLVREYDEVVWFDCDLVVVDPKDDFPAFGDRHTHALVRHFERDSEVPNSGVWRLRKCDSIIELLNKMTTLEVFKDHGWWEQAALMTLMGYSVPPQGSEFRKIKCRAVCPTKWHHECMFMRLAWNSHPNYQADAPRIVHCSYPDMPRRIQVMRHLVENPTGAYPHFEEDPVADENEECACLCDQADAHDLAHIIRSRREV